MIRTAVFWASGALLGLSYVGFPLVILVRGRIRARPYATAPILPTVSVVIAAHNEAATIGRRIRNLLELDYPAERLELIVVSDGSNDGTDDVVRAAAPRVTLVSPGRVGKGTALGLGVAESHGEILVFSDANSMYAPDAIRALVRPFADPSVGGVAGNQVYLPPDGDDPSATGERGYWNFDRAMKRAQSRAGSVTGATGAIYAIRRSLFRPIPEGVTDDLFVSMGVVDQGQRLVFAEDAVAFEPVAQNRNREFERKVRIMTRSFRCLSIMRRLFDPRRSGFYAIQLLWHKVLLRTTVVPLSLVAVTSLALVRRGRLYAAAAAAQAAFYGLGAVGVAVGERGGRLGKVVAVPAYLCLVQAASIRALRDFVRGRSINEWTPRRGDLVALPPVELPADVVGDRAGEAAGDVVA